VVPKETTSVATETITKHLVVLLLEECNFSCPHCFREDGPMYPGYELSFEQMQACLADCQHLRELQGIHFSGEEPTLWTDGDLDFVDLLLGVATAGIGVGFTTNGSSFLDLNKCRNFFRRYFGGTGKPLHVHITTDTFHDNFDVEKGRSRGLDNVIRCKADMPSEKAQSLRIAVPVTLSKDVSSLLPDEMIAHYEPLGVTFNFMPLVPHGKAKLLKHLCPDLRSDKPEDLGAFYRFHRRVEKKKPGGRFYYFALIDDAYYLLSPSWQWRQVGKLGDLDEAAMDAYSSETNV